MKRLTLTRRIGEWTLMACAVVAIATIFRAVNRAVLRELELPDWSTVALLIVATLGYVPFMHRKVLGLLFAAALAGTLTLMVILEKKAEPEPTLKIECAPPQEPQIQIEIVPLERPKAVEL